MTEPKIDGEKLILGGREFIVPPINLKRLKNLLPLIESLTKETDTLKQMDGTSQILHAALSRNYPEITLDEVEEMIDLGNFMSVLKAVLGGSGFLPGGAMAGNVQTGMKSTST